MGDHFDDAPLSNSKQFDQFRPGDDEDEEEEEFNEHSDVPRPANYDEKQYYVEANRIKYVNRPSGSRDFEHVTSEVIDQEENDNGGEKRPSISVRARGLITVLSKMMRSVNFTMVSLVWKLVCFLSFA